MVFHNSYTILYSQKLSTSLPTLTIFFPLPPSCPSFLPSFLPSYSLFTLWQENHETSRCGASAQIQWTHRYLAWRKHSLLVY